MKELNEISAKVAAHLKGGEGKLSRFYHLLKTHKIPEAVEDPEAWLEENGFPVRGIISGNGSPTERISGFVDFFLNQGMQKLKSFLRDSKHALQIVEELNEAVERGEISLEEVAFLTLDVFKLYPSMPKSLGRPASKKNLNSRPELDDPTLIKGKQNPVSTASIMKCLDICLANIFFEFNEKTFHQHEWLLAPK